MTTPLLRCHLVRALLLTSLLAGLPGTPCQAQAVTPDSALREGPPAPDGDSQNLSEEDRQALQGAATAEGAMDLELVKKGGLTPFVPEGPVSLAYRTTDQGPAEYLLEIQASMRIPGRKAAVPHRRIYTVRTDVVTGDDPGTLDWEFKILDARESRFQQDKDGKLTEVLVINEREKGAITPLITDLLGQQDKDAGLLTDDRALEWLRLVLPERPRKQGFGWRVLLPSELGSRREFSDGLYLLHRMARLPSGQEVAAVRGRFRSRGMEQSKAQFQRLGQDRVLFDVTRGRVLYREFRMEGSYLRKTEKGKQAFQARIKGLLMEKSLLEGLTDKQRIDRLNAANAVFGG